MVACYEKKGASCDWGRGLQDVQKFFVQGDSYGLHGGFQFVVGEVARPDDDYLPSGVKQQLVVPSVPFAVAVYLRLPESGVGLWMYKLLASLMSVPETAVDENRRSVSAHHYIRLAGHALDIEPVAVSVRPQPSPHRHFRLGRLAADMRHAAVALCSGVNISDILISKLLVNY